MISLINFDERSIKKVVLDELHDSKRLWYAPEKADLREARRLYAIAIKAVRADKKKEKKK